IASPPASRAWTFTMLPPTCGPSRTNCSPRKPKPKLGSNPCSTNSSTVKKPACSTSWKPYPQAAGLSLSQLLQRDLAYFQTHREHLHYQALAAKGSPIGTGAMESTCGQLQTRVKRTGQFWQPAGLANMLALKAALQNDDWYALWSRN